MEHLENAWILEYRELAWKKSVHGVVQAKPSLAHPVPPKGQQAAIEEMCAKSAPHSFEA
jgi:hypothetical protein